ncbi:importin-11 [Marchantia polymorpha subsp. ruderalis]|uniref:Importin N-terminal domain-containing protein n=2 Tax=Marchantia polymorpha TaxID=3197 RepID=A0AAF6BS57_MARPO|nr:hypothetical protein MARPO_0056s0005 [Marchantia polymorpha]BBN14841.1 hypothetical protein Mp_6g14940 [Marchantia polymorpha subsp. ruderalis]|eukprot:PTQ37522.1 hypothetical protein MARPO_0056s0005 [Marchantia polymorpha]
MALSSADLPTVFSLLQNALSQDQSIQKPAEATLASCENRPGFCSCLLEIIASRDLEKQSDPRWLASVYFKNSINRYWRIRRDTPGIGDAEKPYLRSKLLDLIREEDNKVAVQLALLIAKIARFDYPRDWPELFPMLLQKLQSPDVLLTQRVYLVLNQTLKELSTKRLAADQRNFAEITSQLFDYTWHHWFADMQLILQGFSLVLASPDSGLQPDQGKALSLTCERWLLCSKVLRRMLLFGFQSDAKSVQEVAPVKQVSPAFLQAAQSLLQYRAVPPIREFVEKACLRLMKTLVEVQSTHPFSFSNKAVLPPVLDFCYVQVTEQSGGSTMFEHFLIKCMIFIQSVIQCASYRSHKAGRVVGASTPSLEEAKGNLAGQAEEILQSLLDKQRLVVLSEILVRRYFVLTGDDLEEWAQEPEAFHHEQEMVQWREKLRPCAESLYLALFERHREMLAPLVVEMLKQASDNCPPAAPDADMQITPALLLKEAVYNAVGVANYDLYDYIDFKSWYDSCLAQELHNRHPNGRILRRRVAWLVGQWVSKIKDEMRRPIYSALLGLLGDNDLAVKLAACRSLHNLIDDVHFYEEEFVEFVPTCLQFLFEFMGTAQEFDSKLQIFNLVSLIIERLGEKVLPCVEKIMSFLPQVWQASEGQSLLRIQVILALQRLLMALGPQSPMCYELLFPILQYSTDVNQPDELNMLEDGMQLWQTTLRHAPVMVPQLQGLFPHLVAVMEKSFDHLQVAMNIIESYVLLGGADFLRHHAAGVVKILDSVVGNVNEKGMMCTLPVVDTLIQCFPGDAPAILEAVLQKLVVLVVNGRNDSDIVRASSGAILARILVQNSGFFAQFTSQQSLAVALQQSGVTSTDQSALFLFFDAWLDKIDSLTTLGKRKVCALALCVLLTLREPQILDRLEQILSVCTSVLHETEEEKNGNPSNYSYWSSNAHSGEEGSVSSVESEESRKRQVLGADPINSLSLAPLLKEKLQTCAALHGEAAFNTAMSRLHPMLLGQLQQLLQT